MQHRLNGLLLLLSLASLVPGRVAAADQPMIGEPAPGFRLESLSGEVVDLQGLRGKIVVLHFATSWCPFCNAEAPHLQRIAQEYAPRGVEVLTVDVKETPEAAAAFAERAGFTFPVLLDRDGQATARYAPEAIHPELAREDVPIASNLILDEEGVIRFYSLLDTAAFDAKLTKLENRLQELVAAQGTPRDDAAK